MVLRPNGRGRVRHHHNQLKKEAKPEKGLASLLYISKPNINQVLIRTRLELISEPKAPPVNGSKGG